MRNAAIPSLAFLLVTLFVYPVAAEADPTKLNAGEATYWDTVKKAQADYRKVLASALPDATRVEVFLLDFDYKKYPDANRFNWDNNTEKDVFPIVPYYSTTRILARKDLTPEQIKQLMPALQATVSTPKADSWTPCHFPIHGIRLSIGGQILFQTSLCWKCENFFVKYPDGTTSWSHIEEPGLKAILNELMPIPAAETERFKKTMLGIDLPGK